MRTLDIWFQKVQDTDFKHAKTQGVKTGVHIATGDFK